ncbi:MAG: hypothetical protein ACR2JC_18460 [Chloroflexota bacterium]
MKKTLAALILAGVAAAPCGALNAAGAFASPSQSPLARGCRIGSEGYEHSYARCVRVPDDGRFRISVPHTDIVFIGIGSRETDGTKIGVTQVPQPCPALHGTGVRIAASGDFRPLNAREGQLYRFDPETGDCTRVNRVTSGGIYEVVNH